MAFARIASLLALLFALSACANTVRGVGKDVKGTADAVADVTS